MKIRVFEEKDYSTVKVWWEGHGWPSVPFLMLPKLGVMAEEEGNPVAAAWLYMDNSIGVSMLEWLVADPEASGKAVFRGIGLVCAFLEEEARRMDYGIMLTTCKQEGLAKVYERNGFTRTDSGMIHLVKVLKTKEGQ